MKYSDIIKYFVDTLVREGDKKISEVNIWAKYEKDFDTDVQTASEISVVTLDEYIARGKKYDDSCFYRMISGGDSWKYND